MLVVLAMVGLTAACGSVDLSKANYQRTTVPAEPGSGGQGEVPRGPIDDPAVSTETLRTVDPCALLSKDALAALGDSGRPRADDWSECRNEVTDAGGKTIDISLRLGETFGISMDKAKGNVAGLPLVENKQDPATCFTTAITDKDPDIGITVQIGYEGGDPCRTGRTLLGNIVKALHEAPGTLTEIPGSLVRLDPCATVDTKLVGELLGPAAEPELTSLHGCAWVGESPELRVDFRLGYMPSDDADTEPVDLGGGVKGLREAGRTSSPSCAVTWLHLPTGQDKGELVKVDYTNYTADKGADDACGKAVEVAKGLVASLPKP